MMKNFQLSFTQKKDISLKPLTQWNWGVGSPEFVLIPQLEKFYGTTDTCKILSLIEKGEKIESVEMEEKNRKNFYK